METHWYATKSNNLFYLGADGLPQNFVSLQSAMDKVPSAHSYVTHDGARKHNDYRFDWIKFEGWGCCGFTLTDCPF